MSAPLDEGLLRRQKRTDFLCRRFRNTTLIFTGVMLLLYFLFKIQHWAGTDIFLSAGLFSILLQTTGCVLTKKKRTLTDILRLVGMVAVTLYLLHNRGLI